MKKIFLAALLIGAFVMPAQYVTAEEATTQTAVSSNNAVKTDVLKELMTFEEVMDAYQKEFPNSDIESIELDHQSDGWHVSVEGIDDDNKYEIKLNASTKEVTGKKEKKLDVDEAGGAKRKKDKLDLKQLISFDEAAQIALKEVKSGEISKFDVEHHSDGTYWEIKLTDSNKEYEVTIDAYSKKVIDVKEDD
ncbi:PepSY domain-containing protein [Aerococcaceae bacterium zg-BR9]|uniref:PepSY domain-containing protein n=1 Tax=Aerococcaceae bacterium zg-1292 TaxID=2774330 RepID=UPI004063511B|nr:PepSY domain-containing protein [Aerococcaceae bacterium zg-BR9]MBF6626253.1 PepSY domain-containing protein [Aerococcaceae bacterium zg-BR9]